MIWAIGDLHLDHSGDKPMDIFGDHWMNHEEKIFRYWEENIQENDIVLLVGDFSWALKLKDAIFDLEKIDVLPGKKFFIKGNHDYWWSSLAKMNNLGFKSLHFVHNNGFAVDGIGICGTRGWSDIDSNGFDEQDEKIYKRELARLQTSINQVKEMREEGKVERILAMIHYPPFSSKGEPNDFAKMLEDNQVDYCYYGHLHGVGHRYVVEGNFGGVEYRCVASDYIDFIPYLHK